MSRLLIQNAIVLDPTKGEILEADVLIKDELIKEIKGPGEISNGGLEPGEIIDCRGRYLAPGLIEPHIHIESSMLTPIEFAKLAVVHGTTAVFVDPHEIANVSREGIEMFLKIADLVPLDMYVGIPSCVPATHLEDAGNEVTLEDIKQLIDHPRVYGLAEMMNFPGIINGFGDARAKVDFVFEKGKIVDGHCPGVRGEALTKYITNGKSDDIVRIMNDHESTTYEEALEKAQAGMYVAMRYGSASKDLDRILPGIVQNKINVSRFMLCSDDLEAQELVAKGHLDRTLRRARQIIMDNSSLDLDLATLVALKLATNNPGRYFEKFFALNREPVMGKIAEGKRANLIIFNDLDNLKVNEVIVRGKLVARAGNMVMPTPNFNYMKFMNSVHLGKTYTAQDFTVATTGGTAQVNVIEVAPQSLVTKKLKVEMPVTAGELKADPGRDIVKIAVIERHKATGKYALGFVKGLGIKKGAVATTVGHDSHNLVVVGADDASMAEAVNRLAAAGGGMIATDGKEAAIHPLEVCGLMSFRSVIEIGETLTALKEITRQLGTPMENIFMTLSFVPLAVIPELRITDQGLVDVNAFKIIPLTEG